MMLNNEVTSEQVRSYASEILRMSKPDSIITPDLWDKIKSVAGSALTQAPNKVVSSFDIRKEYFNHPPLGFSALVAAASLNIKK